MEKNIISVSAGLRLKAEKLLLNRQNKEVIKPSEAEILKLLHELEVYTVELELQNEELINANTDSLITTKRYQLSENEKLHLIHEFEVNQLEMELQNEELMLSKSVSQDVAERYSDLFNFSSSGYLILSKEGEILDLNFSGAQLLEKDRFKLKNSQFGFFVSDDDKPIYNNFLSDIFILKTKKTCEINLALEDSRLIYIQLTGILTQNEEQCLMTLVDITDRQQAIKYLEMTREILQILNEAGNIQDSLHRTLTVLKKHTDFDAVGIRLQNGNDFPYLEQLGFSNDFILSENTLIEYTKKGEICRDKMGNVNVECTCGLVISGKANPKDSFITPGGSFWTNDSTSMLDIPRNKDARLNPRNHCTHKGYKSIALVPIRDNKKIVGLIQFNDVRKGIFNTSKVEFLEGIALHIGSALMRKQAEETLRKNEELLRTITDNAPDIIIQLDQIGTILYINHPLPGYNMEECIGRNFCEWTLPEYHALMNQSLNLVFNEAITQSYYSRSENQNSILRWYRTSISPVKDGEIVKNAILIAQDISENLLNEEILRESEDKQNAIILTAMDGFWLTDRYGYILEVNDTYCHMSGYSKNELLTMRIQNIEIIESPNDIILHLNKIVELSEDRFETKHRRKDGSVINVEISVQYRKIKGGQFVIFLHDITKRKESERALFESNEQFRLLFENSSDAILFTNPDGTICSVNPEAERMFERSTDEIVLLERKDISDLNDPRLKPALKARTKTGIFKGELNFLRKDGTSFPVEMTSIIFKDSNGIERTSIIARDITERKQTEISLLQSEKFYRDLFNSMIEGFCIIEMIFDENNKAINYRFLQTNATFEKQTGLINSTGKLIRDLAPVSGDHWLEHYGNIALTGQISRYENEVKDLNRWFDVCAFRIGEKENFKVAVCFNDITERKKAEELLNINNARLTLAMKVSNMAWWEMNITTGAISFEKRKAEMLGYLPENFKHYKDFMILVHPEDSEKAMEAMRRHIYGSEDKYEVEYRILAISGEYKWFYDIGSITERDINGKAILATGLVTNITERKHAEEIIKESEEKRLAILQTAMDGYWLLDKDGRLLEVNETYCKMSGYSKQELLNLYLKDLDACENETDIKERIQKVFEIGEDRYETKHRRIDGSVYDVEVSIQYQLTEGGQMVTFIQDITERKQRVILLNKLNAELEDRVKDRTADLLKSHEILKANEEKFRTVADFATNWEFWIEPNDAIIYCSPSCEPITGYRPAEFIENSNLILDIIHPDDLPNFLEHKIIESNAHICEHEIQFRIIKKDGTVRWIGHFCQPVFDDLGNFKGTRGSNKDINSRKKMEELLTTSNQKYKLLSENINDGIFICKNGRFEYVNKAIYDIFGYEGHELENMKLTQLVTLDFHEELENILYTNSSFNQSCNIEIECLKKDFSIVFIEILLNYVSKDKMVYGVIHEITDKKLFQKNMVKAIIQTEEKERAHFSKELHDGLGPLLSTIKLYLQWSERPNIKKSREEIVEKAAEILEEALTTVKEISNKLSPHLLINYGLNSAIKSFVDKLNATASFNIVYESNSIRRIDVDIESALYRAVIECINNTLKYAEAKNINIILNDTGNKVEIRYKDDGAGFNIPETLLLNKGLGLFNLQNRLHTIGGKVDLKSESGKGVDYLFTVNI